MQLPPGPKTPSWIIGLQFSANPFSYMDRISKRYGDIITLMFGSTPIVYVSNPSGIKEIFTNTKEIVAKGNLNRGFALGTGEKGVLQLDGLIHKNRRKILMQTFHGARMQACGKRICQLTEKIIGQQTVGKPFIAYPAIEDITLKVAIEVIVGLDEGERHEKIKRLFVSEMRCGQSTIDRILLTIFGERDLGRWSPHGYMLHLRQEIFQFLLSEIEERRNQLDLSRTEDMLADLIFAEDETGQPLSNEEVRDLLLSPIYAAADASGTAIAWALYWIHRLSAVRSRLLSELDSLGDNLDPMSIFALPYLNAVCNEILRIYPTQLFAFPRLVESTVEVMGYKLNPGTVLIANIYSTHQQEDLYPQPKEFQPERFLEKQFSPYEFLPFGGGSRVCIGASFALFEMKLILATILSRYELELVSQSPERPKYGGLICSPASGVKMVMRGLRQRQGRPQALAVDLI